MNQLSDMLLTMTSSVSDLGTVLKAHIAKNKLQLAEKHATIEKLENEIKLFRAEQDNASAEADAEKDVQIDKLQKEADEATEMYLKTSEEKDDIQKKLYTEMNKVDQIQMELELAERERDIALRKQGINSEQKQLLAKMEHEGYKINETIERIEHISDMIRDILLEETEEDTPVSSKEKHLAEA